MPEIKFKIDEKEYTLFCENGEEEDLKNAVNAVNEKMKIFKMEKDISLTKKFLMVSILLASDSNKAAYIEVDNKIKQIDELFEKIERLLEI